MIFKRGWKTLSHFGLWADKKADINSKVNLWLFLKSYLFLFLEFIIESYWDKWVTWSLVRAFCCYRLSDTRTKQNVHYLGAIMWKVGRKPFVHIQLDQCRLFFMFRRILTSFQCLYQSLNKSQYIEKRKKIQNGLYAFSPQEEDRVFWEMEKPLDIKPTP